MNVNDLKKIGFIYKRLSKNWYLCRIYANKKAHPILYHVILPFHIRSKK